MIIDIGEKVHIIERRYFPEDLRGHFIGEVTRCTENIIRVKGYTWVFDSVKAQFIKKPDEIERIIRLGERITVNVIPPEVNLSELNYVIIHPKGLVVTDGKKFSLDITEFTAMR